jgi:hypothetical protein
MPTGRLHAVARDTRPPNNARPLVQMADRCILLDLYVMFFFAYFFFLLTFPSKLAG